MVVPTPGGVLNPLVMLAAEIAGADEVWRIGGAQAVAALAYGTQSIKPVDKITGPGNAYVAAAKRRVFGQVGIDLIAGPSEILVVADRHNDPAWIAADLLSQAEHDASSQSVLIADDAAFADAVAAAVDERAQDAWRAPRSRARAGATMAASSWCPTSRRARPSSTASPPSMSSSRWRRRPPRRWPRGSAMPARSSSAATRPRRSATMSPAPTTCCRPRARRASRAACGVADFLKRTSIVACTPDALAALGPAALALAEAEGLGAHGRSVSIRLNRRCLSAPCRRRPVASSTSCWTRSRSRAARPRSSTSARWRCSTSWRRTTSPWSAARPAPTSCRIGIFEQRLVFDVRDSHDRKLRDIVLSLTPFRKVVKDYFLVCESYYAAIKKLGPSQIEALDMGRRGLHNEGSELLRERLAGKIEVDLDTARRLFTLICALHITS